MDRQQTGKAGEIAACRYLEDKGYQILERNFRCRFGEIDLIALWEDGIVFVEVKTRRNRNYGRPGESVGWKKQQHLKKIALFYLSSRHKLDQESRFDVIEVEPGEITHIENAFGLNWV